jgi:5-methylcytosine-specific restriction endonuclease McrA
MCYTNFVEGRGHFYLPVKLPLFCGMSAPLDKAKGKPREGGILIRGAMLKRCGRCTKWKLVSEFYKDRTQKDGYSGSCKICSKERKKEWCSQNRNREREHNSNYYYRHLEEQRERNRSWHSQHPEKDRERTRARRARIRGAGGTITTQEWEDLKKKYNYTCLCCKHKEPEIKLTLDHVLPLILGGRHEISNAQPLCSTCNFRKHTKHIDYR